MTKSVLEVDPSRAMEMHDVDREGAMELAGLIAAKYGAPDVRPEDLRAMLAELAENGLDLIQPPPSCSAN